MIQPRADNAANKAPEQRIPCKIRVEIAAAGFQRNHIRSHHCTGYQNQSVKPQIQRSKMNAEPVNKHVDLQRRIAARVPLAAHMQKPLHRRDICQRGNYP